MSWSQKHIDKNLEIVKKILTTLILNLLETEKSYLIDGAVLRKYNKNYDKLRQLALVEEFKRCIQSDVKTFLDEKQVETLEEATSLADDYYPTHKFSFTAKPKPTSSHPQNKFMSGNSSGMPSQSNTLKPNSTSKTKSQYPLSRPTCNYCKKPGHLVSECLKLKRKLRSDEATNQQGSPLLEQGHSLLLKPIQLT